MPSPANFIANGNISPSVFVKIDATVATPAVIQAAANSDYPIGISKESTDQPPIPQLTGTQFAAIAGENCKVYQVGDTCLLSIGAGGCTAGDKLTSDANGNGVTASAGQIYGAIALETVAQNFAARVRVTDPIKM